MLVHVLIIINFIFVSVATRSELYPPSLPVPGLAGKGRSSLRPPSPPTDTERARGVHHIKNHRTTNSHVQVLTCVHVP